jgi:hypothetical protein
MDTIAGDSEISNRKQNPALKPTMTSGTDTVT